VYCVYRIFSSNALYGLALLSLHKWRGYLCSS